MHDDMEKMTQILRDLFDEYQGEVTRALSARDVPQWDSLSNVQFVVMVEQVFGIRFITREVGQFRNVGEVLDMIEIKRQSRPA